MNPVLESCNYVKMTSEFFLTDRVELFWTEIRNVKIPQRGWVDDKHGGRRTKPVCPIRGCHTQTEPRGISQSWLCFVNAIQDQVTVALRLSSNNNNIFADILGLWDRGRCRVVVLFAIPKYFVSWKILLARATEYRLAIQERNSVPVV